MLHEIKSKFWCQFHAYLQYSKSLTNKANFALKVCGTLIKHIFNKKSILMRAFRTKLHLFNISFVQINIHYHLIKIIYLKIMLQILVHLKSLSLQERLFSFIYCFVATIFVTSPEEFLDIVTSYV